jgi:hypothetical protein
MSLFFLDPSLNTFPTLPKNLSTLLLFVAEVERDDKDVSDFVRFGFGSIPFTDFMDIMDDEFDLLRPNSPRKLSFRVFDISPPTDRSWSLPSEMDVRRAD